MGHSFGRVFGTLRWDTLGQPWDMFATNLFKEISTGAQPAGSMLVCAKRSGVRYWPHVPPRPPTNFPTQLRFHGSRSDSKPL